MKIRILQGFSGYEQGQVFEDWPRGVCVDMVAAGLIEEVKDAPPPPVVEATAPRKAEKKRG